MGESELHASLYHPTVVLEGVHLSVGWMLILEKFQFLLLDHVEHVHEDIYLIFKILVEASLGDPAVFDDSICRGVLQTILGKFFHSGVHDRFAFLGGEVEKSLFRHRNVTSWSYDHEVTL